MSDLFCINAAKLIFCVPELAVTMVIKSRNFDKSKVMDFHQNLISCPVTFWPIREARTNTKK